MLRALLVSLILLNLLFLGWTQGWLDAALGLRAQGDREPERLQLETQRERLTLLSPQAVSALKTRSCLELAPLVGDAALKAAQATLERFGLGASEWQVQSSELPGLWVVATNRFQSDEQQGRKQEVFKRLKLDYSPLQALPAEHPSLVLSQHASSQAAETALEGYGRRALRGLRVLQLQAPGSHHSLKLPHADGSMQQRLLSATDATLAPGFKACAAVPAAPGLPEPAPAASPAR